MNRFFTLLLLGIFSTIVKAQTVTTQPYGKVDQADLEMKDCDFEKGANAMVLFDYAAMDGKGGLPLRRHTRIKVFNEFGKWAANVSLEYYGLNSNAGIVDLKGETINLENGKVEITPLDPKEIYKVTIDKWHTALKFAMPKVKAGSIIEYTYCEWVPGTWYFQNFIPVRYSEIELKIPQATIAIVNYRTTNVAVDFKSIPYVTQPYVKTVGQTTDGSQIRAMANIHSMPEEPYTGSRSGNLQRIEFIGVNTYISTWPKIGELLMKSNDFGYDLDRTLTGELDILKKVKTLKSDDDKIAYIFDEVKNRMKWDGNLRFYTTDGTVKAWDKRIGNSAEINMMVYHLLKKAGIKAYPLVVCIKDYGKINPANPSIFSFNNTVVYIPVDSAKMYVLDASNKHNLFNAIPTGILNTFGLCIDADNLLKINDYGLHTAYNMVFISNEEPVIQSVSLTVDIKGDGKMEGEAEITSYSHNKIKALRLYETVGEVKYIDSLRKKDNTLSISSFKMENAEVDSLPLSQKMNFRLDLTSSDENYIYFSTNLFNSMGKNPFYNDERFSDIDFGYLDNQSIIGVYKVPNGYKADVLPKSISIVMPDQSILFRRTVAEDNGTILVKYVLTHKKTIYFREEYPDIRGFYKKMHELMNEQIVLKKS